MKPIHPSPSVISVLITACLLGTSLIAKAHARSAEALLQDTTAKPEKWQTFLSSEGRFSILLPGMPAISEEVTENPPGRFVWHKYQVRTFAEYLVAYADYPSVADTTSPDVFCDQFAKALVAEVNLRLLSISKGSDGDYPGRLLRGRMPDGSVMQAKIALVGQRIYHIAITTPKEDGVDPETVGLYGLTASKFLDSFVFIHDSVDIPSRAEASPRCPEDSPNCQLTEGELRNRAISIPAPEYPAIARAARASGIVQVRVLVDEQGTVIAAHALSGHPLLQAAAVAAARTVRFSPLVLDNKTTKMNGIIRYLFVPQ